MRGLRLLAGVALVGTLGAIVSAQRGSSPSIVGVWRVSEVTLTGPNARKVTSPQPGLRIFSQRHYSVSEVTSDGPRPELPQGQPTDKQLADAFGPFTGQSGTYEIKGNEVTTRPVAAKNPNAMRAGSFTTYAFRIDGNVLTMTQKATATGPTTDPTTFKFTRVE